MKSKLKFRIKWKAVVGDEIKEGIESEASWFLVTQQGLVLVNGPMKPIKEASHVGYQECEPLIKINNEWLSIDEIEKRISHE